jgi:hypothetical protein
MTARRTMQCGNIGNDGDPVIGVRKTADGLSAACLAGIISDRQIGGPNDRDFGFNTCV